MSNLQANCCSELRVRIRLKRTLPFRTGKLNLLPSLNLGIICRVRLQSISLLTKDQSECLITDGFVKPSPASQRAVLETVAALTKQGHECIEFTPPDGEFRSEIIKILLSFYSSSSIGHLCRIDFCRWL